LDPFIEFDITTRTTVRLNSLGNLQVVLLGQEAVTFSLEQLQIDTITLGSTPLALRQNGEPFAVWSDVDGDGLMDLVLHFSVSELRDNGDLTSSTTQLTLHGTLDDGRRLRAFAEVRVLGQ
jgi:hypothetical protein